MKFKRVVESTRINSRSEHFSKEALESAAASLTGSSVAALTAEHNPSLPPFGKVLSASIQLAEDGEWELFNEFENFEKADSFQLFDGMVVYEMGSTEDKRPFKCLAEPSGDSVIVSMDVTMIENKQALSLMEKRIGEVVPIKLDLDVRHGLDPMSIFLLSFGGNLAAGFIKGVSVKTSEKLGEKFGEKLLDKVIDKTIDGTFGIAKNIGDKAIENTHAAIDAVRSVTGIIAKDQRNVTGEDLDKIMLVVAFPGHPTMELAFMLCRAEEVDAGLAEEKREALSRHAERLKRDWAISKVQYIYRDDTWVFNFLLTDDGKVLASETAFNRLNSALKAQGNPEIISWSKTPYKP